ncbi:MAG: class I SAM-dependent methyltransferase [Lachnospiraceae bacterium]|nr:class I SAM-dependent methyltransferase [Lachnospiraceae bacterium]
MIKADLMNLPFADNSFDYIHSDGVLHHTPDTKLAMKALYDKVRPGGVFWFYIYKEMNPVKHFCDDYIRQQFKLSPEEALEQCRAITELGRELSKIDATITLEKPINVLNIPSGTFNLQRFVYYNFIKCFWNGQIGYDVSNIVNFDWYHPNNAQQQTEEEVRGWMKEYGIEDYDIYVANPNGMNVVIRKNKENIK